MKISPKLENPCQMQRHPTLKTSITQDTHVIPVEEINQRTYMYICIAHEQR